MGLKLSRFLKADNPMVEGSPSAIIHTVSPQAIIEVMEGHVAASSPHRHFTYNDEQFTFIIFSLPSSMVSNITLL